MSYERIFDVIDQWRLYVCYYIQSLLDFCLNKKYEDLYIKLNKNF